MRHYMSRLLTLFGCIALAWHLHARVGAAQQVVPVPCPDLLGPRPIVVDGIVFSGVTFIKLWTTSVNGGYYTTSPSDPVSDNGMWVWFDAHVDLLCYDLYYPNGVIQHAYSVVNTYGPLLPSGGGGGGCGTELLPDPGDPDPPCPGGGTGGGTGGRGGGGGCTVEWIIIEVQDSSGNWVTWWQGYARVC